MYNEKLKRSFIEWHTQSENTARICETIFRVSEKYETEWGADLCTQDEDTIKPMVENIVGFRSRSKLVRLSVLKEYARWCIRTGVPDACDALLKIKVAGLDQIKTHTVSSPDHLESYLNIIFEPAQEKTSDNIYRCYYWLAYAGMNEEDILKVKVGDVDFTNMVVRYKDEEYPIYREAVPCFKNCVELTSFVFKHPAIPPDKTVYKDRAPGNTLIRGIKSGPSLHYVRVQLSRRSKQKLDSGETDLKLSHFRVWISGLFYRVSLKEKRGIEPDFMKIVYKQRGNKVYKLDSGRNTQDAKLKQLARDYSDDYQRWKLAYRD